MSTQTSVSDEGTFIRAVRISTFWIAVAISAFHIYTSWAGLMTALVQRAIHLTAMMVLAFLNVKTLSRRKHAWQRAFDVILAVLSVVAGLYVVVTFEDLMNRVGSPTVLDLTMGVLEVLLLIEATNRSIGWQLPVVSIAFLAYGYAGPLFGGWLAHRGFSTERIVSFLYLTTEGIYGQALSTSATYIAIFVLFGAFLEQCNAGPFFIDLAFGAAGKTRGGSAKTAVIAAGLFGTMSGSAVANVVTTGTFTIPLMKKTGYSATFAAAVEAVAASGGLVMPPVMGAAAFIMSEMTGIPYGRIALSAAIPAILLYLSLFVMVDLEAGKRGLAPLSKDELPDSRQAIRKYGHMLVPLAALVYFLIIRQTSPMPAGFWATVLTAAIGMLRPETRLTLEKVGKGLADGAKQMVPVATACACSGILTGIISLTGLGLRFSQALIDVSGGNVLIALMMTMLACTVLGMGVPPTAVYIIMATLGAPALVSMNVPLLAAHMFIFYYSAFANITPPVALASYASAGLAECDPMVAGWQAFVLGLVAYVVPFMFVYGPSLLGIGTVGGTLLSLAAATVGVFALSVGLVGWFRKPVQAYQRVLLGVAGLCLIDTRLVTDAVGLALIVVVFLLQMLAERLRRARPRAV